MSLANSESLWFSNSKTLPASFDLFPNNSGLMNKRPRFNSTQPTSQLFGRSDEHRNPDSIYGDLSNSSMVSQNSNNEMQSNSVMDGFEQWDTPSIQPGLKCPTHNLLIHSFNKKSAKLYCTTCVQNEVQSEELTIIPSVFKHISTKIRDG